MNNHLIKPELLAPAGHLECACAAFENGADAVYLGLSRFNARDRSAPFSMEDFAKLCQFAKHHQKKVYLALNTLLKEDEFPDFLSLAVEAIQYQPDAVILQDIGAAILFRRYFPDIPIHASTQMGFHNSYGIKMAQELGFSRVILERQIELEDLKIIRKNSTLELELFIHGALCLSLSGACLFSSWQNGCSGNRGKCKQPCRRQYTSEKNNSGYFLSPTDLNLLRHIPILSQMGINSFKIEGRLRKPDYVAPVCRAYRTVIDANINTQKEAIKEAEQILQQAHGRIQSEGFLTAHSKKHLIQFSTPPTQGSLCGKSVGYRQNFIWIKLLRSIHLGDRIRLQSPLGDQESIALTVTQIKNNNQFINHAKAGDTIGIPCSKKPAFNADVFIIGNSPKSWTKMAQSMPQWKNSVSLKISINQQGFEAELLYPKRQFHWTFESPLQIAQKNPVSLEDIQNAFSITGNPNTSKWIVKKCHVQLTDSFFIPSSILKKARQSLWEHLTPFLDEIDFNPYLFALSDFALRPLPEPNYHSTSLTTVLIANEQAIDHILIPNNAQIAMPVEKAKKANIEAILPSYTTEKQIPQLKQHIKNAWECGIRRFRLQSLAEIPLLKELFPNQKELQLTLSFPIPLTNSLAISAFHQSFISQVMIWPELEKKQIEQLSQISPIQTEIYQSGHLPILATTATISTTQIKDDQQSYFISQPDLWGIQFIMSETLLQIEETPNTNKVIDLRYLPPINQSQTNNSQTTPFNFLRSWQ